MADESIEHLRIVAIETVRKAVDAAMRAEPQNAADIWARFNDDLQLLLGSPTADQLRAVIQVASSAQGQSSEDQSAQK